MELDIYFLGVHLGTATSFDLYEELGDWDSRQYSDFKSACTLPDCSVLLLNIEKGVFEAYLEGDEDSVSGAPSGGVFNVLETLNKKV